MSSFEGRFQSFVPTALFPTEYTPRVGVWAEYEGPSSLVGTDLYNFCHPVWGIAKGSDWLPRVLGNTLSFGPCPMVHKPSRSANSVKGNFYRIYHHSFWNPCPSSLVNDLSFNLYKLKNRRANGNKQKKESRAVEALTTGVLKLNGSRVWFCFIWNGDNTNIYLIWRV